MKRFLLLFSAATLLAAAQPLSAQQASPVSLGVRAGVYFDPTDLFLGGEVLVPLGSSIYLNPNLEYVLVEGGTVAAFNLDAHYDFPIGDPTFLWFGLGLGLLYSDPEGPIEGELHPGLNILLGLGFDAGPVIPYSQLKAFVGDNNQISLGFGLRF